MTNARYCMGMICFATKETAGDDVQFVFEHKGDEVKVAFEGTNSVDDVWNNLDVRYTKYSIGDKEFIVHKGYLDAWLSVKELIMERIKKANPKSIVIAGHYLGGALAILCFGDVEELYKDCKLELYTYGSVKTIVPRDKKAVEDKWGKYITQYRNGTDLIPWLPPVIPCFGYKHLTKLTQIGEKFNLKNIYKCGTYHYPSAYYESLKNVN